MVIVFFSRKGGSGKSTLAAQLAAELAKAERVSILDLDPLGTLGNWALYRKEHEGLPRIAFVAAKHTDFDYALTQLKVRYDHVIVDLQGADTEENRHALLCADKIVLPFKPTQPDLDNAFYTRDMLSELRKIKPKIEVYYVINEACPNAGRIIEPRDARLYLEGIGISPLETVVFKRKAYRDSMALGKGACELRDEKAKGEIEGVSREIFEEKAYDSHSVRAAGANRKKTSGVLGRGRELGH